jgi:predicted acylesterase/phospholipase RssA
MEVGFYRAIEGLWLRLDFIVASSIGTLNGAFIAGSVSPTELGGLWRASCRKDGIGRNLRWLLEPRRRPGQWSSRGPHASLVGSSLARSPRR